MLQVGVSAIAQIARLLVEPACAAAISPLYFPAVAKDAGVDVQELNGPVVAIVCGGSGVTFKQIQDWRKQVGLAPL
ncbi:hypothetical protein PTSG_12106 [Salpingoeca rosetta]|uniref:Tryptophan synthase beta chain-like PALP domain-containing protein n=1 Tax=Salpingoeca rosetta (strain ATCC 50818 / BSB-021) TaxID=946362 RepID=F2U7F4_SALR5|nr:uncharacterized protein PTSG_12106 [Salpingoeca rosetta]EGD83371.1 hypothetical protein PTSG_12106 [Salpingoeca rosetta]|eukprot:XP_004994875.1 hypothetical protein PTSG_12106 [Salpingoeca rosetta]